MKTVRDLSGDSNEPWHIREMIDKHKDLDKSICRVLVAALTLSAVSMIVLFFSLQHSASPPRIAMGLLAGLWIGAYGAQWLWVASRIARGEGLTGNVPGPFRMWRLTQLFLTAPLSFVRTLLRWRYLTQELKKSREHACVQEYLADEAPNAAAWLTVAVILYLGGSAVLMSFLAMNRGS